MTQAIWQIVSVMATWVVCTAIQWGVFREKIRAMEKRMDKIEGERFVTRGEYEGRHGELSRQVAEIRSIVVK